MLQENQAVKTTRMKRGLQAEWHKNYPNSELSSRFEIMAIANEYLPALQ